MNNPFTHLTPDEWRDPDEAMVERSNGQEAQDSGEGGSAVEQETQSYLSPPITDYVEVFFGRNQQWFWRRKARNGQVVSTGGEGYTSRSFCFERAQRLNPGLEVRDA